MSSDFTRIGYLFWEWQPIRHMDPLALKLWLVIYTKSAIPGLWCGDIPDLSSQSFLTAEETLRGLEILRERELIEFDRSNRVLRLTKLPDAGEWPAAPAILKSWWSIFQRKIPACAVRDAHVTMLRWLLDEGAKHASKNTTGKPSALHEQLWEATFAQVAIPASRRRGVRSFGEADMGSEAQQSLFQDAHRGAIESQRHVAVDNSACCDPKNLDSSERVSRPSGEGEGDGEGDSFLLRGGGSGEGATGRPRLTAVNYSVAELADVLWPDRKTRPVLTESRLQALRDAIVSASDQARSPEALELLREFSAKRTTGISPDVLIKPGGLTLLVQEADAWKRAQGGKLDMLAEARKQLGF